MLCFCPNSPLQYYHQAVWFFPPGEVKKRKVYHYIYFFSHYIWHGTSFHMFRKASLFLFFSSLFSQLDQFILHFSAVLPSVAWECVLICGSTCTHSFSSTSEFSRLLFFFWYTIQNDEFPIKFFSYFSLESG